MLLRGGAVGAVLLSCGGRGGCDVGGGVGAGDAALKTRPGTSPAWTGSRECSSEHIFAVHMQPPYNLCPDTLHARCIVHRSRSVPAPQMEEAPACPTVHGCTLLEGWLGLKATVAMGMSGSQVPQGRDFGGRVVQVVGVLLLRRKGFRSEGVAGARAKVCHEPCMALPRSSQRA